MYSHTSTVKRAVLFLVAMMMSLFLLAGCGSSQQGSSDNQKKTVVVTTSFLADMVHQLAGKYVNVEMIIPAGDDPHLYVAKPQDLSKLNKADLVLYHGLHFEGKMVEALEKKGHAVSVHFPKDQIGQMDEDGKVIIDPHFWFNIDLYELAVKEASAQLQTLLPDHKADIEKNTTAYLKQLDDLKVWAKAQLDSIPKESRYLVTPHDAFNYFSRYYGIPVMAPQGVSTEGETSNKDLQETAEFIAKHHIKAIFAESTTDPARMKKLQEIVRADGGEVKVVSGENNELFSDSLAPKGHPGDTYIDMYKHNIELMVKNLK